MKVPLAVGVPLIVIVLLAQAAVTPAGSPVGDPIPVAPVVVCVIFVSAVLIHTVGVDEATPAVLSALLVIIISSVEVAQLPLLIVHLSVAELPAARAVTVVVAEDAVVIVAEPLINDQAPVPTVGLLAAMVNVLVLHCAISAPAFEVVGKA